MTITGGTGCFPPVYDITNTNSILNLTFDATAIKMAVGLLPTQVNVGVYWFTVSATYTTVWKIFTKNYPAFQISVIDCHITATAAIMAPVSTFYNSDVTNPVSASGLPDVVCIKEANNCSLKIGTYTSTVTACGAIRYEIV